MLFGGIILALLDFRSLRFINLLGGVINNYLE